MNRIYKLLYSNLIVITLLSSSCNNQRSLPSLTKYRTESGFFVYIKYNRYFFVPTFIKSTDHIEEQFKELKLKKGFIIYRPNIDRELVEKALSLATEIEVSSINYDKDIIGKIAVLPVQVEYKVTSYYPKETNSTEFIHFTDEHHIAFDYDMHFRKIYSLQAL